MKRGGWGILIALTLAIFSINFISSSSCAESNSLGDYYRPGSLVGDTSTINSLCNSSNNYCNGHFVDHQNGYWAVWDYCDGDYIFKTWCMDNNGTYIIHYGVPVYERHLCQYGCEENKDGQGYCLSAPKVCAALNQTVKDKIIELQNAGEKIYLIEGNSFVDIGSYVVISQGGYSKVLQVEGLGYNSTTTWVYLKDAVNNENLNFIFNKVLPREPMLLTIDGQNYYIYAFFETDSILFLWGNGASNNLFEKGVGTETTISCPKACQNGICSNSNNNENVCVEDWTCTSWGDCTNNIETRHCTDSNNCGTVNEKPSETSGCSNSNNNETICIENWVCGDWNKCVNKIQNRSCIDSRNCGTIYHKPITLQNCTSEELKKGETIEVFLNNTKVIFERDSNGTNTITTNKTFVKSSLNITEESEKLYAMTSLGNKEIKILPEEAINISKEISNVNNITLNEYKGEIVYIISGTKETKLLFIIPMTEKIETRINADNGNMMLIIKPWWHFLTFGV